MPATMRTMTTASEASGFLAIWSDVDPADETDYLHWLTREHVEERLSVPGFLAARVFRTEAEGRGRFLIFYRLREPSVVGSKAYLARLNAPTPWSQKIMPKLKNFIRGGGKILQESGSGEGVFVSPLTFAREEIPRYRALAAEALSGDRVAAARIFEVDQAASEIKTSEKSMRAGDRSFEAMLLLEALDEAALDGGGIYRQIFSAQSRK